MRITTLCTASALAPVVAACGGTEGGRALYGAAVGAAAGAVAGAVTDESEINLD